MPQGVVAAIPKLQFSANGQPMVGGTLTTYVAGTTTPTATWQDAALVTANTNPITLDSRGECVLWVDPAASYKFVLKNAAGVVQWTQDNISNMSSLRSDLGASLIGYDGSTVQAVLDNAVSLSNYAALRAYTGRATGIRITSPGIAGSFQRTGSAADNGGTVIVDGSGRSWQRLFDGAVNVQWFGAVGDGFTNDTQAFQRSLSTGKAVYVPGNTYIITAGLLINTDGQALYGDGVRKSNVVVVGDSYDAVTIQSSSSGVKQISFFSPSPRASGSFIKMNSPTRGNFVRDFSLQNGFIGINIDAEVVITFIENGEILDATPTTGTGIIISGGNDTFISRIVMDSSGIEPSCGIQINRTQAIWVSDSDIIDFGTPLRICPDGAANGLVTWCFFSQFALDTSNGNGIEITASNAGLVKGLFFDNCWSATNRRGVYIATTTGGIVDTVHFTDSTFYNNDLQGVLIDNAGSNVRNIELNNSRAAGNSQAASGVSAGFDIASNVVGFSIRGCRSGAHAGFPATQSFGVLIGPGCNQYHMTDNDLTGNAIGAAVDGSAGTSVIREVRGNLGYKTQVTGAATIVAGQNQITVNHGLSGTPSVVLANPSNVNLGGLSFWTGTFTATTFSINTSGNVPADSPFSWSANIYY